VYTREVDYVPAIYSELFQNIQSTFREAGLDMTASHFRINLPPNTPAPDRLIEMRPKKKR
jgi:small-conductance mechanosensitive channel